VVVSTYVTDGRLVYPVARTVTRDSALPEALRALLDGTGWPGRLRSVVPPDVRLDVALASGDHVVVRLVGNADVSLSEMAVDAIVATALDASGGQVASVFYNGRPVVAQVPRPAMLYFASPGGLVAVPGGHRTPRAALDGYLSANLPETAVRLPADIEVREVTFQQDDGLVTLGFSFPESLHTLAVESPALARTVLLGLIATLTDVPGVRAVRLDFDGRAQLGLGQCSDLLRTPQPRPRVLNDERVLDK
jgi:spore germination protein GerM